MTVLTPVAPEEVLFALLKEAPAVNALLLKADGSLRIHPGFLQEQKPATPCASFTVVSDPEDYTTGGRSTLRHPLLQLDLWDTTNDGVKALSREIREALSGFRGVAGSAEVDGVFLDTPERAAYDSDAKLFRRSMDWRIWYREV